MTQVSSTPHAPRSFFVNTSGLADSTVSRKFQGVPYLQLQDQVRRYPLDHPVSMDLLKDQVGLASSDRWLTHGQIAGTTGLTEAGAKMLTQAHGIDRQVVNELGAPLFEREAALGAARLVVPETTWPGASGGGAGTEVAVREPAVRPKPAQRAIDAPPAPKRLPISAKAAPDVRAELVAVAKPATGAGKVASAGAAAAPAASKAASRLATQLGKVPGAAKWALGAAAVLGPLAATDMVAGNHLAALPTAVAEVAAVGAAAYGVRRIAAGNEQLHALGKAGTIAGLAGTGMVVAAYLINRGGGNA